MARGRYQRHRPPAERASEWLARPETADRCLGLLLAVTALARFAVFDDRGAPATVDSGNWLAFGHSILGSAPRSSSIVYPPVVPLLTTGVAAVLGPVVGVALLASVSSVLPALALYLVLRRTGLRWSAVLLAGLLAASASIGEAAAWGGFPQLIGLALVTVFVVSFDAALRSPTWAASARTAGWFGGILLTSHFAAIFAGLTAGMVLLLAWAAAPDAGGRRWAWPFGRWRVAVLCAVPVVLVLPIYRPLLEAIAGNRPQGTDTATATVGWSNLIETVEFTYREAPLLWRALVLFAICAPIALLDRWRTPEWRIPTSALVAIAVGTAASHEARFLAFLPTVVLGMAALWVLAGREAVRRPRLAVRTAAVALAVALLAFQSVQGIRLLRDQRDFYGIVAPGTYRGMQWLRSTTDPDTVLGVATVDEAPLGWWFEGYVGRPTFYASPLRWLSYPDELRRAEVANAIFTDSFPDDGALVRARRAGIDLLVVPTGSSRYDPTRMRAFLRRHPDLVAYRNGDVIVLRTTPTTGP